jgi:type II restriction/modification system DNA methylase subunit YeeA
MLSNLFTKMATGGYFGTTHIAHFNGGLFKDAEVFDLTRSEISDLLACAEHDWSHIEPSIFGTLFERSLDPAKRAQLGAFYTSKSDIETLLRPVFETPLLNEWDDARDKMQVLWKRLQEEVKKASGKKTAATKKARQAFDDAVMAFRNRLWNVVVLDPACGSGNFLYTALKMLLDLEKEAWEYATARDVNWMPNVNPTQLRGIEVNAYARELAQVVVWIGYLQWVKFNGFGFERDPVLGSMEEIREQDSILDVSDPTNPKEPDWPDAEFIVGNPPFLGGKMLRSNLGDDYVDRMFRVWRDRVEPQADLCCYWFEKARAMIQSGRAKRAGLLATQGIRGGANSHRASFRFF